jgi:hypothetical protein
MDGEQGMDVYGTNVGHLDGWRIRSGEDKSLKLNGQGGRK